MTVTAETTAELRRKRDEVSNADLVELRLDTVSDPNATNFNHRFYRARLNRGPASYRICCYSSFFR